MNEIIDLVVNNGIGVACVIYMIYFQSTTMKEMLHTLGTINTRLAIIEDNIGLNKEYENNDSIYK